MNKQLLKIAANIIFSIILLASAAIYLKAHELENSPQALKDAVKLAKSGKQDEAIAAIKKIIAESPDNGSLEAHLSLGLVYFKSKQYDNAFAEFDKGHEIRKDSPMAYYFKGLICEKKAKAVEVTPTQAKELKKNAITYWQTYLDVSAKTTMQPSESHKHIGITKEESIKRAKKHIQMLKEELANDKK